MANLAGVVQQLRRERDSGGEGGQTPRCRARRTQWRLIRKTNWNEAQDFSRRKGEDRGCPKSAVGEGASERRSAEKAKRCHHAEEENRVGYCSTEDRL